MQPGGAHVCNGSCSANTLICSIDRCGFETHDIDSFHLQKSVLFLTPQNSPHPRSTEKWGSLTKPKAVRLRAAHHACASSIRDTSYKLAGAVQLKSSKTSGLAPLWPMVCIRAGRCTVCCQLAYMPPISSPSSATESTPALPHQHKMGQSSMHIKGAFPGRVHGADCYGCSQLRGPEDTEYSSNFWITRPTAASPCPTPCDPSCWSPALLWT